MNIKLSKQQIKLFFSRYWAILLLGVAGVCALVTTVFDIKNGLDSSQIYTLFITDCSVNNELDDYIKDNLNTIKEVNIYSYASNDIYYQSTYPLLGLNDSDVIIMPKSEINYESLSKNFGLFSENTIDGLIYDGKCYGIKIYDSITKEGKLKDYITYSLDEDYYLLVCLSSSHSGISDTINESFLEMIFSEKK